MGSIDTFIRKPAGQLTLFLAVTVVAEPLAQTTDTAILWMIAGIIYAAFILTNSILISGADNVWQYFLFSLILSVVFALLSFAVTSGYAAILNAKGGNESSMVYLISIYHPFALLTVIFLRWVYSRLFQKRV
jgi:hypothetical protein